MLNVYLKYLVYNLTVDKTCFDRLVWSAGFIGDVKNVKRLLGLSYIGATNPKIVPDIIDESSLVKFNQTRLIDIMMKNKFKIIIELILMFE